MKRDNFKREEKGEKQSFSNSTLAHRSFIFSNSAHVQLGTQFVSLVVFRECFFIFPGNIRSFYRANIDGNQ